MSKLKQHWLSLTLGSAARVAVAAFPLATHSAYADDNGHNPHIRHALEALHEAHDEISNAPHNFHGQRREALDVLDHAIQKLDEIKDYDN
jgi:hypothetical protein